MRQNLVRWGAAVGALPRILHYRKVLGATETYFERLRIVNEALGAHWVFRLADAVGPEQIKVNRPSWYRFYVEDIDGLHCPLDPGAPETETYLGRELSDMDLAFYAGMGFDGYRLALETQRIVSLVDKSIDFDHRYRLAASLDLRDRLALYDKNGIIPKEDYYSAYCAALTTLFKTIEGAVQGTAPGACGDEVVLERSVAGCLILLCGGHQGCLKHPNHVERFQTQMESLIIFHQARRILTGQAAMEEPSTSEMRSVA